MPNLIMRNAVLAASLIPIGYALPAQAQKPARTGMLEEVIVSAQHRDQSLQDVPISIAAFSNTAINNFRIENLTDLNVLVPNLSAVEGAGGIRSVLFQIRGLYASGTALGSDSGVATYLDGVYMRGGSASIVNNLDLERIEVLRGPQGTLFGRNTSGGAISFITRNPTGEFGFRQKVTMGNYDLFESKTRIDTPQWGVVRASLSYNYSDREGPVKNSGAGFSADFGALGGGKFVSPERLGDERTQGMFLALQFDLDENLNLVYKYDYTDVKASPAAIGILAAAPSLAPLIAPSFGDTLSDTVNNAFHLTSHQITQGHNLTAEYALTDTITLRNILSYREASMDVPGHTLDGLGQFAPAVIVFTVTGGNDRNETSEEFQVIWDEQSFILTTGLMYYDLEQSQGGYNHSPNGYFGSPPPIPTIFPGSTPASQSTVDATSTAIYSQLEYHLTSQWDLLLGGRYTSDKKDYVDRTLLTGTVLTTSYDESEPTYLVGVNYKPADNLLVYAKYSTGYISGGIVSGISYEPEKAKSLEIGGKASWFDNTLQTNFAWFMVDYTDQQFVTSGALITPPLPTPQVIVNAGETESQGFELEVAWLPVDDFTLGMNLGYLDFDFKKLDLGLLGGPLSEHLRPQWSGSLSGDYETDPVFGDATMRFHVDASYRSAEWASTRPAAFTNKGKNPDTWRFNASVSLAGMKLAGGAVELSVWGRNLTDKRLPANMNVLGPIIAGQYEFPRTYGVDLTYEY